MRDVNGQKGQKAAVLLEAAAWQEFNRFQRTTDLWSETKLFSQGRGNHRAFLKT